MPLKKWLFYCDLYKTINKDRAKWFYLINYESLEI